jgi:hypothetical protein
VLNSDGTGVESGALELFVVKSRTPRLWLAGRCCRGIYLTPYLKTLRPLHLRCRWRRPDSHVSFGWRPKRTAFHISSTTAGIVALQSLAFFIQTIAHRAGNWLFGRNISSGGVPLWRLTRQLHWQRRMALPPGCLRFQAAQNCNLHRRRGMLSATSPLHMALARQDQTPLANNNITFRLLDFIGGSRAGRGIRERRRAR